MLGSCPAHVKDEEAGGTSPISWYIAAARLPRCLLLERGGKRMTIIVEGGSREPRTNRTFRAMFEDRKSVFVDRFELDQFDDEHATYLIIADEHGDHLGSARLLLTTRPHILTGLFAGL